MSSAAYQKAYRAAHKAEKLAYNKLWAKKNPERVKAQRQRYRERHAAELAEYAKRYRLEHKDVWYTAHMRWIERNRVKHNQHAQRSRERHRAKNLERKAAAQRAARKRDPERFHAYAKRRTARAISAASWTKLETFAESRNTPRTTPVKPTTKPSTKTKRTTR